MDSSRCPRLLLLLLLPLLLAAVLAPSSAGVIRLPSGKAGARACAAPPDPAAYDRPVIGIVSHPGDGAGGRISNGTATSYIGASYVKFVEAAGARVIPLVYNEPEERLLEDNNILETFDAQNQASTLQFPSYSFEGTVFQRFDSDLIEKVSTSCLVMQNHRYGISSKRLRENDELSSFFRVLTTSPDENGKVYVSTVQANKYPITCTQWHPEKAIFEWRKPMIPHSEDAVQVTQHFANHFISQARKSPNRPPADKVLDNLIYNYNPTFSGKTSSAMTRLRSTIWRPRSSRPKSLCPPHPRGRRLNAPPHQPLPRLGTCPSNVTRQMLKQLAEAE
ncbi:gamma-glutamyl hydrolase 2-like [Panicum miliaceum]|uniref:Gamma-glutamyl hydrolase 2-like n=1 Tax=Panicum miliaceum TaxID=4540 RepID=A0A3L6T1Z3_PANMI|nr:gamma-glutamyl hydrolase 2-like [Panicum miliaceum]